jgi:hypothetical protein
MHLTIEHITENQNPDTLHAIIEDNLEALKIALNTTTTTITTIQLALAASYLLNSKNCRQELINTIETRKEASDRGSYTEQQQENTLWIDPLLNLPHLLTEDLDLAVSTAQKMNPQALAKIINNYNLNWLPLLEKSANLPLLARLKIKDYTLPLITKALETEDPRRLEEIAARLDIGRELTQYIITNKPHLAIHLHHLLGNSATRNSVIKGRLLCPTPLTTTEISRLAYYAEGTDSSSLALAQRLEKENKIEIILKTGIPQTTKNNILQPLPRFRDLKKLLVESEI